MRQPQHRNRARARARRQPNPANKVYESNGPDVKVRGTPQQIAEKYLQLGRDALSSGDAIKAENYFQHAEHYLRIIAAALEQQQQRRQQQQQRRQETLERRKGNGDAQSQTVEAAETSLTVEISDASAAETDGAMTDDAMVVESADASAETGTNDAGTAKEPEARTKGNGGDWGDQPPQFLTTPVLQEAGDAQEQTASDAPSAAEASTKADTSAATGGNGKAGRAADGGGKTTRRRTTTRRKGNGSARTEDGSAQAQAEPTRDSTSAEEPLKPVADSTDTAGTESKADELPEAGQA